MRSIVATTAIQLGVPAPSRLDRLAPQAQEVHISRRSLPRRLIATLLVILLPLSAAAASALPAVRLSFRALDLTRPPTNLELMAAGQLGGALTPTHELADKAREAEINLSFGMAIQAWNDHDYRRAVVLFEEHLAAYPDSPWAAEAELHLGCDAQYQGRFRQARRHFETILGAHPDASRPAERMMVCKARMRLGALEVLEYNFEAAAEQFRLLKQESPDWRHRTYAAHWLQRLSRYRGADRELLTCGFQALAHLLELLDRPVSARHVRQMDPSIERGQSISRLVDLAARQGVRLEARRVEPADISSLPLPAIIELERREGGALGHYWVVESVADDQVRIHDPQSTRTFHQSLEELAQEWEGVVLLRSGAPDLPGRPVTAAELDTLRGGCCGAPAPESDLGNPGDNGGPKDAGDPCGGPRWNVNMLNMNFHAVDVPIWYRPAYGPMVSFALSYNSQSAIAYYEPFGPKWQFNYASYLVVDTGGAVLVFMPDGRRDQYTPAGAHSFLAPFGVHNELVNIGTDRYELRLTDGTVYVYARPDDIAGEPLTQILLTEIRDTYGQSLTFSYDGQGRLVTITDALGQVSTLTHDGERRVTGIADPFGRSVAIGYDAEGNLASITDMGGYTSTLTYDEDRYITSIDGARGRWTFYTEPSDDVSKWPDAYPPPGDPMWANYRVTVTNPLGKKYEYFWYGGCEQGFGCRGTSWYVSPRDYVEYRSQTHNTLNLGTPKTRYVPYDHPSGRSQIARIITPEGRDWSFAYDADGNLAEFLDTHAASTSFTYNDEGQVTSMTDPLDKTTTYLYAPNGLDLIEVRDVLGTTLLEYNTARDLAAITDRLGNRTEFTYNGLGQLTRLRDPRGVTTQYTYTSGPTPHLATREDQTVYRQEFDARGRAISFTRSTGLTVELSHDDLDRLTQRRYPDGSTEEFVYSGCCLGRLESFQDRSGLVTRFSYDALSRLTRVRHPDDTVTRFAYDANGNTVAQVNRAGMSLRFEYDLDGRLTRRIYADDSAERYEWDEEGWIDAFINGRGTRVEYGHDARGDLTGVVFSDDTPDVTYIRDDAGRISSRSDGTGTTTYVHDAESRLKEIDGPWTDDVVVMDYDGLGRLTAVTVTGGDTTAHVYDVHGRLDSVTHGTGVFDFSYTGASPLEDSVTAPTGTTTIYEYDGLDRIESITHRKSGGELISRYAYTFTTGGRRAAEVIERVIGDSAGPEGVDASTYNESDQLLSSDNPPRSYLYDADGNLVQGVTRDGYIFSATYDAENHLTSLEWTDGSGQVHRREHSYDGDGWRVRTVERLDEAITRDRRFVRGPGWFLQERDASNSIVAEYVWDRRRPGGVGGLLLRRSEGSDGFYLADGRGNVGEVIDGTETVVAAYDYDAFGVITAATGSLDQDFRFASKPMDEPAGLVAFGRRFYSPSMGRWLTRDPLREEGGVNFYAFVENDPINAVDAWGLFPILPLLNAYEAYRDANRPTTGRYDGSAGVCSPVDAPGPAGLTRAVRRALGGLWGGIVGALGGDPDRGEVWEEGNAVLGVRQ